MEQIVHETFIWELFQSAILPVLLFAAGYLLNHIVEKRKEKRRLKDLKNYFLSIIDIVCELAEQQSRIFSESSQKLQNVDGRDRGVRKVSGFPDKSLNDFNHNDLFKIFIKGKRVQKATVEFSLLLTSLGLIQKVFETVEPYSAEFELTVNGLDKRWSESVNKITSEFRSIANTRDVSTALQSEDPYVRKIGELMQLGVEKKLKGYKANYENIVLEMLKFINSSGFVDDKRNTILTPILSDFMQIHEQRIDIYKRRSSTCNEVAEVLMSSISQIKSSVRLLT